MKKALSIMHAKVVGPTLYQVRWDDRETVVIISAQRDIHDFGIGKSMRDLADPPDFRIGIKFALERALRNFGTDKEERRRFTRDFYKAWPEAHPNHNPPKGPKVGDVIAKIKDGEITYKTPKKEPVSATGAMLRLSSRYPVLIRTPPPAKPFTWEDVARIRGEYGPLPTPPNARRS